MEPIAVLSKEEMVRRIEARKTPVLDDVRKLRKKLSNWNDYYYKAIMELSKEKYFFETWMVINWIGLEMAPKRVLEIGTRNGGSLVALLRPYKDYSGVKVESFDIWHDPMLSVNRGSPKKVKSNLEHMGIPTSMIEFHSGDSTVTVPQFFKEHPEAKFDYVLVDGGHDKDTAASDLRNVENSVAPGGVLVFDDISEESYGLLPVWEGFKARNGDKFRYFEVMHRKGIAWAFRRF
ncbi:MAG: class I SAM-dependent methyltransferase [Methanobacteriota archaeon]